MGEKDNQRGGQQNTKFPRLRPSLALRSDSVVEDNVKRRGAHFPLRLTCFRAWEKPGDDKATAKEKQRKSIQRASKAQRNRENAVRNGSHVLDVVLDGRVREKTEKLPT